MKKSMLIIASFWTIVLSAQNIDQKKETVNNAVQTAMSSITREELKEYLSYLSSSELEGRNTGQKGQKMASKYLKDYFEKISLEGPLVNENSYFQEFKLYSRRCNNLTISTDHSKLDYMTEFMIDNENVEFEGDADFKLIFIGYGQESDYFNVDVKGKVVMYFDGIPAIYSKGDSIENQGDFFLNDEKFIRAMSNGAAGAIQIYKDEELAKIYINALSGFISSRMRIDGPYPSGVDSIISSCMMVPPTSAARLLGISTYQLDRVLKKLNKGKRQKNNFELDFHIEGSYTNSEVTTENVLGYIEGTDKKDELIIVMAHYDHLGKVGEDIFFGANDNASGTSALLEIAEAFSETKSRGLSPRRSILFMLTTAEEKGLLGSKYYSINPVFPLDKTKYLINMDMLGRNDSEHEDNSKYIYLDVSEKENSFLHKICIEAELESKVVIKPEYKFLGESYARGRSDHMSFKMQKIPYLYYYNGIHQDYHKPTDVADKINYVNLEAISQLIFTTIYRLSITDE